MRLLKKINKNVLKILLAFVFLNSTVLSFSQNQKPFKLDALKDGILFGSGIVLSGGDLLMDNLLEINRKEWDGKALNKDDVNAFDRFFMCPYSDKMDKAADFALLACAATPALLAFTEKDEWFTEIVMYSEALLIANGLKEITKMCVTRNRPYMYYEIDPDLKEDILEGDFANSFPSGHTTIAFTSATFTSYTFCKYFPDSVYKYPVVGLSYGLAAATSAFRIKGGNHFMTDVISGAVLGSAVGFLVPWLHTFNEKNDLNVSLLANGISFKINI